MKTENQKSNKPEEKITRKEAIVKTGKYAAFTAVGMMVLLSPKKSQAESPTTPPAPTSWP
jgi:hypothetical protein